MQTVIKHTIMKIRIGVPKYSTLPAYNNCSINGWTPNQKCLLPGVVIEIIRELCQKINVAYELIEIDQEFYKEQGDGLNYFISNHTVDTLATFYVQSKPLLDQTIFEYSNPVLFLPYLFAYKFVDNSFLSYLTSLMKPFTRQVWTSITLITISLFVTWIFISSAIIANVRLKLISMKFFDFFDFFKGEVAPEHIQRNSTSKKFYFTALYIFTTILSAVYQNGLLVSFREGKGPISVTSFTELVSSLEDNVVKIVTDNAKFTFFQRVSISDGELFERINRSFSKYNFAEVGSKKEVIEYLMTGDYIYPTTPWNNVLSKSPESCQLAQVYSRDIRERFSLLFRKNSSFLPLINEAIANSWPMINFYLKKYELLEGERFNQTCVGSTIKKLNLKNFIGPYVLVAIGLVISLFSFLFEFYQRYHYRSKNIQF